MGGVDLRGGSALTWNLLRPGVIPLNQNQHQNLLLLQETSRVLIGQAPLATSRKPRPHRQAKP